MKRTIKTALTVAIIAAFALIPATSYAWRCCLLRPFCGQRAAYRASFYQSGARVRAYAVASNCVGGACYASNPAPCEPVGACAPVVSAPCENGACDLTVSAPAPCEPVEACAPVVSTPCENGACDLTVSAPAPCEPVEYYPADDGAKIAVALNELIEIVNETRARHGVAALRNDATLEAGAVRQARFCAYSGTLTHGADVAEILAVNASGIRAALGQWLNSPAHRSLLLNGGYRFAGVAVVRDNQGRAWCAVRFR